MPRGHRRRSIEPLYEEDDDLPRHRPPIRPTGVSLDGFVHIYATKAEFVWTCPSCRRRHYGTLNGRWVVLDGPSFEPVMVCAGVPSGSCRGHWRLVDGRLVPA